MALCDRGGCRLAIIGFSLVLASWVGWARCVAATPVKRLTVTGGDVELGFVEVAAMPAATVAHTATVLEDGNVLVVGGYGRLFGRIPIATSLARTYQWQEKSWRVTKGHLNIGRLEHAAVRLVDGRVLIAGGTGQDKKPVLTVELYDPRSEEFVVVGKMAKARRHARLSLVAGGRVLISGMNRQCEIVEPSEKAACGYELRLLTQRCAFRHVSHTVVGLADGSVLLVSGGSRNMEVFDPVAERFEPRSVRLPAVMDDQAVVLLHDGRVLLAGGQEVYSNRCVPNTWVYDVKADVLLDGPRLTASSGGELQPGASDIMAVDLFAGDPQRWGRYVLLCGGEYDFGQAGVGDAVLDSAWVYDALAGELIEVGPMVYAHDDSAAVLLGTAVNREAGEARALIVGGHGLADSFEAYCEEFSWRWVTRVEPTVPVGPAGPVGPRGSTDEPAGHVESVGSLGRAGAGRPSRPVGPVGSAGQVDSARGGGQ